MFVLPASALSIRLRTRRPSAWKQATAILAAAEMMAKSKCRCSLRATETERAGPKSLVDALALPQHGKASSTKLPTGASARWKLRGSSQPHNGLSDRPRAHAAMYFACCYQRRVPYVHVARYARDTALLYTTRVHMYRPGVLTMGWEGRVHTHGGLARKGR